AFVGVNDQLLAVAIDHEKFADSRVEVPSVVGQLLMIELEFAVIGIQTENGGCVEVCARTRPTLFPIAPGPIVQRRRIGGAPPYRVGLRIVTPWHPSPASSGPP